MEKSFLIQFVDSSIDAINESNMSLTAKFNLKETFRQIKDIYLQEKRDEKKLKRQ